jgi:tetratricopeptide (TPR) repeat protein
MAEVTIEQALRIGIEHQQSGRLGDAEQVFQLILQKYPDHCDAMQLLGVTLTHAGRLEDGVALLRRSTEINPRVADYWSNLGNALRSFGRLDESVEACRRAIALNPNLAEAHNNLGISLRENKQLDESIAEYQIAIKLKPDLAEAYNNLGHSLALKHRQIEAITAYQEALRLQPTCLEAANNLGTALADTGQIDEAIALMRRVIQLDARYADAYSNLGLMLPMVGRAEEGLVMCRRATALAPNHAGYHWNLSLELLSQGIFAEGWREFEWRWLWKDFTAPRRTFSQPMWRGEELNGRTILLHFEQGFGDTLQFVRYAPMLVERGGKVITHCQRELGRLLKGNPELGEVFAPGDLVPSFDLHCPLMSLPLWFRTDLKSIPAKIPYLKADSKIVDKWKERLEPVNRKFKVGLIWAGSTTHPKDRLRSMEFAKLLPLAQVADVTFVNLQKGTAAEQAKEYSLQLHLIDFMDELDDFAETAGLVANLDLVIGVDTSVIHLAGAMGKPVWAMVPLASDWRWLRGRDESPWYPTLRLFRQRRFADWDEVVGRVAAALYPQVMGR